ncbi:MAG: S8 family serine peptidase [Anaerolineae bacterium]|nr:S8 family serine peptidase [Anaerolineae bacterium]
MKKHTWVSLIVIATLLFSAFPVMAQETPPLLEAEGNWYIVELNAPALAVYAKASTARFRTMSANGKLNVQAPASQGYIRRLQADQATFRAALSKAIPNALVAYDYQILLNAVAVQLPNSNFKTLAEIRALPGVKRMTPQHLYEGDMDYSLPQIAAEALWGQLGGRANAGTGIKVAIIDSGIEPTHAMFSGSGWSYPTEGQWPKGYCLEDASFCNGKIIVARYYTPTFAVNENEVNTPLDIHGHGVHVSGTAVGNIVTATYGTATPQISGVAPGAWLMTYKSLFQNVAGTQSTGSSIVLAAAIEDAIADGADVVNCSWGGDEWEYDDPLTAAYDAAVDAGVTVIFSLGNSGPNYGTAGSPTSSKLIEVGASQTVRAFYNSVSVTAPTPVSATLQNFPAVEFKDIAATAIPTQAIGPLPYIPCDLLGNPDLTMPGVTVGITETEPYASGWIALIPRGTYNFSLKLDNAIAHGADAVLMYTDNRTWKDSLTAGNRAIYTVIVANAIGLDARDWWSMVTDTARLQIGYPVAPYETEVADKIADFSSRGPNLHMEIQPDLVAPGVNILSAAPGGIYAARNGTSQAAPHVTGAAALLLAQHPDWTPSQVKSALMNTASQSILELDETTPADVMTQGAGRIDLSQAGNPGLTFNKPSQSFGMVKKGTIAQATIIATEVAGAAETYTLSAQEWVTNAQTHVTISPATLNVAANGTAIFTVTLEVGAEADIQDIEGNLVISGSTHLLHIPYWARINPATTNTILLIDDDLSSSDPEIVDYRAYYTQALDELGLTYDVWDTTSLGAGPGFPTRAILDGYDLAVYFSGDDFTFLAYNAILGWGGGTPEDLRLYLVGGGKMIVFGQNAAWGFSNAGVDMVNLFSADYEDDNIFGANPVPRPSAVGLVPFLNGKQVDFSAGGDGAGNLTSVDDLSSGNVDGTSSTPLFGLPSTSTPIGDGFMGAAMSSDPTLEGLDNPIANWWKLAHRTTFCSFGLEGVNNDTGYYTRTALLGDMMSYVNDDLAVAFSHVVPGANNAVIFTATITSSVGGEALRYRWDFGDGSDYISTTTNTVTHQYAQKGAYQARVEVTDSYWHTAVSEPTPVNLGEELFLPLVLRGYPAP